MSPLLLPAILAITSALIFYTLGVFTERKAGDLSKKQLILFWLGLVFDTTGTTLMAHIAGQNATPIADSNMEFHAITGALAIILMLFHAFWATWVVFKGSSKSRQNFHNFSTMVWAFWLVPYLCGIFIGNPAMHMSGTLALILSVVIAGGIYAILKMKDAKKA